MIEAEMSEYLAFFVVFYDFSFLNSINLINFLWIHND